MHADSNTLSAPRKSCTCPEVEDDAGALRSTKSQTQSGGDTVSVATASGEETRYSVPAVVIV